MSTVHLGPRGSKWSKTSRKNVRYPTMNLPDRHLVHGIYCTGFFSQNYFLLFSPLASLHSSLRKQLIQPEVTIFYRKFQKFHRKFRIQTGSWGKILWLTYRYSSFVCIIVNNFINKNNFNILKNFIYCCVICKLFVSFVV